MPSYSFKCPECDITQITYISAETVNTNKNWNKIKCSKCNAQCEQVFEVDHLAGFIMKGWSPDKDRKIKHTCDKQMEVANEPLSGTEIQELPEISAEYEKSKGKQSGSVLGGVKPTLTEAEKTLASKIRNDKKRASKQARSKV